MDFIDFLELRKIKLTPFQIRLSTQLIKAVSELSDSDLKSFLQLQSGTTFTFEQVERYFKSFNWRKE